MAKMAPSNRVVFRGDSRGPEEIFKSGFSPNHGGEIKVTSGGRMTGGVSTSKDVGVALRYAACYGGYVYAVFLDSGVDIINHMAAKYKGADLKNAFTQMEIAAGKTAGNRVIAARKANVNKGECCFLGTVKRNTECKVDEREKKLGEAFLGVDVKVSVNYA